MRLFFAAMLPEDVQRTLGKVRQALDWLPVKGTWSQPANLHVTLKFLGDVPDERVNEVALAVKAELRLGEPMKLRPESLVYFPQNGDARVLGLGLTGDTDRLIVIQQTIESVCEKCGYPREARAFAVHVTLARFKDGLRAMHRPRIEQSVAALVGRIGEFELREVQLMQSVLSARGSEYAAVARYAAT